MEYSNTTSKAGILQTIEQTLQRADASITSNAVDKAYFTTLINDFYRMAAYLAWKVDKNWVFDDLNQTTFPMATTTLVNNQRDYALPATALKVRQVEVMDTSGKYYALEFMPEESYLLKFEKEQEVAGLPRYYRLVGNSVILYPTVNSADVTTTAGLRLTIDREIDAFVVGDTTQEPGIPKVLQPILYYGPSYIWASGRNLMHIANMCHEMIGKFPGLTDMILDYYGNRNEKVNRIARPHKSYK